MTKLICSILLLLTLMIAPLAYTETTCPLKGYYPRIFHVDPRGSNMNPGTEFAPFRDLWFAQKKVRAGDLIIIHVR